jgi:hypothetical protein
MTRQERNATVDALLDELDELRRRIYVSRAFGARAAGLRDLKSEFRSAQRRLDAVSSSSF